MSEIFTLEKLYRAYNECKKGKGHTVNALLFEVDYEKNLIALRDELIRHTYTPSRHICFVVTKPVPREIFAADFRDRVIHHLYCNEISVFYNEHFIKHSYSNRIDKGTHRGVRTVREFIYHNGNGYYLKLDIRSFFPSINKSILTRLIEKEIYSYIVKSELWKNDMLWLTNVIIFHDPTSNYVYKGDPQLQKLIPPHKSLLHNEIGKGLPIGNLTSQFFANVYLNELDQFITKILLYPNYARYVDDFLIVDMDKDKLLLQIPIIKNFLKQSLDLDLHPNKITLQHVSKGIDFLGYFIKPTHTLVRQKVVKRFKDKLYKYRDSEDGLFNVCHISMMKSYMGHFGHANSFNLKNKMFESMFFKF